MDITHVEKGGRGAFLIRRDGKRVAEMTYVVEGDYAINIDHTEVDPSLRGQKIGERLLEEAVEYSRSNGKHIGASCPYAYKKLQENGSYSDVFGEK